MFPILIIVVVPILWAALFYRFANIDRSDRISTTVLSTLGCAFACFLIWVIVSFNLNYDYEYKLAKASIVKLNGADYISNSVIYDKANDEKDLFYNVCVKTKHGMKTLNLPIDKTIIQFTNDRPAILKCWMSTTDTKFNKFWGVTEPTKGLVYIVKIPRCKEKK